MKHLNKIDDLAAKRNAIAANPALKKKQLFSQMGKVDKQIQEAGEQAMKLRGKNYAPIERFTSQTARAATKQQADVARRYAQQQFAGINPVNKAIFSGVAAYGGAQGVGALAGAATGDRSGQRQFNYMGTMNRMGFLMNPQGEIRRMQRDMASTRQGPGWKGFIPGYGGFQAGRNFATRVADNTAVSGLQQAARSPLARMGYAVSPNMFMRQAAKRTGKQLYKTASLNDYMEKEALLSSVGKGLLSAEGSGFSSAAS